MTWAEFLIFAACCCWAAGIVLWSRALSWSDHAAPVIDEALATVAAENNRLQHQLEQARAEHALDQQAIDALLRLTSTWETK